MRRLVPLLWLLLASAALAGESPATAPATRPKLDNPLTTLPSAPGPHIEKIKAMGDNSWLILGQASADPKWGLARGRTWCSKMAYAADLGGAFFCGTGVHGATPDGRYMDDLWFYDANAHRWLCLYPGADPKRLKLHLDSSGFEVNEQGDHIPVSYLSHAYNNTTYNSDRRLYHIMWTQCPWWDKALPQRYDWLDVPPAKRTYGNVGAVIPLTRHPLWWNVSAGKWERKCVGGEGPGGRFEGVAEYIASLRKTVYTYKGTTWLYDYAANDWKAGAKVPASVAGYDSNGCYDTQRDRIYVARGKGFAYYDIRTNEWREAQAPEQPENLGATNSAQLHFDSASAVILWHKSHGPIAIYDPPANKWTDMGDTLPLGQIQWKHFNPKHMVFSGFYDAELNVHLFYLAGDSSNTEATILAYRYKNVKK